MRIWRGFGVAGFWQGENEDNASRYVVEETLRLGKTLRILDSVDVLFDLESEGQLPLGSFS